MKNQLREYVPKTEPSKRVMNNLNESTKEIEDKPNYRQMVDEAIAKLDANQEP